MKLLPLIPHEAGSSTLTGPTKVGNLKLKEGGPGGFSREKGYGLFMPTIYTKFRSNKTRTMHVSKKRTYKQ